MYIDFQLIFSHRDLGKNEISTLPSRVFHSQRHLEQLLLRQNKLKRIPPGIFRGLAALQWLLIQENLLEHFPLVELYGLNSLVWLNLSNNRLVLQGEQFPILQNITEMYVSWPGMWCFMFNSDRTFVFQRFII